MQLRRVKSNSVIWEHMNQTWSESLGLDESIVLSNISVSEYPISQANHKQVYEELHLNNNTKFFLLSFQIFSRYFVFKFKYLVWIWLALFLNLNHLWGIIGYTIKNENPKHHNLLQDIHGCKSCITCQRVTGRNSRHILVRTKAPTRWGSCSIVNQEQLTCCEITIRRTSRWFERDIWEIGGHWCWS